MLKKCTWLESERITVVANGGSNICFAVRELTVGSLHETHFHRRSAWDRWQGARVAKFWQSAT